MLSNFINFGGSLMKNLTYILLFFFSPILIITSETYAQGKMVLDEIIVTAERRETNLQQTPIAVSAFSEIQIERRQISETLDLWRQVPNFIGYNNVTLGASNSYFLRGIGTTESLATFDPPVLTYVDGIVNPRQNANNVELVEVERIEVLRGPQGTLFGRNTTGGAINVISKKPSEDYFAKGSVTYGKFDHRQGRVYLNIPLADGLYSSVSGYMIDSDGWQRSVRTNEKYNGIKAHGVRGALRLEGSKITWDASIDYSFQDHQNMQSITDPTVESTNRDAGRNSAAWALGSPRLNDIYLTPCRNGSSPFDWIANGCQANVTKGLNAYSNIKIEAADWMTIDVITGWRDLDHDFVSPLFASLRGGVELPLVNAGNHNVFQQEIKATGTLLDGKLTYTTGIFALKEGNFTRFQTSLSGPAGIILTLDDTTMANDATDLAVYLQTDVDMGNFTLTTGLRWTRNKKSLPQVLHTGANGLFDSLDIRAAGIPTSVKVSKVTPRVALAYELNEDVMLFASATRGFKSGGWNGRASAANLFRRFEAETVWSYELGARTEFLNNRLRANVTLFQANYDDVQLPSLAFIPPPGEAPAFVTNNAGDSKVEGAEIEISALLFEGFNAFANIGITDGEFKSFTPLAVAAGFLPTTVPERNPGYTFQLGFDYQSYVDSLNGNININLDFQKVDEFEGNPQNAPANFNPGFDTMNASIGYNTENDRWGVNLGCKNCLNEYYITSHFLNARFIGDPMTWALRLTYKYN